MAENWPKFAAAEFASKSTWQPDDIVKRALGVSKAENVMAQPKRKLSSSTTSAFDKVIEILDKNKHVMWYRLNLPTNIRACVIINFRARVIVVHSYFRATGSAGHSKNRKKTKKNKEQYIPDERLVEEICAM